MATVLDRLDHNSLTIYCILFFFEPAISSNQKILVDHSSHQLHHHHRHQVYIDWIIQPNVSSYFIHQRKFVFIRVFHSISFCHCSYGQYRTKLIFVRLLRCERWWWWWSRCTYTHTHVRHTGTPIIWWSNVWMLAIFFLVIGYYSIRAPPDIANRIDWSHRGCPISSYPLTYHWCLFGNQSLSHSLYFSSSPFWAIIVQRIDVYL